jgi:adenylate cyclase
VHDQVSGRLDCVFEDRGEQTLRNITRPVRIYRVVLSGSVANVHPSAAADRTPAKPPVFTDTLPLPLPDKPSVAVLPFESISNDPEQGFLADGIAAGVPRAT